MSLINILTSSSIRSSSSRNSSSGNIAHDTTPIPTATTATNNTTISGFSVQQVLSTVAVTNANINNTSTSTNIKISFKLLDNKRCVQVYSNQQTLLDILTYVANYIHTSNTNNTDNTNVYFDLLYDYPTKSFFNYCMENGIDMNHLDMYILSNYQSVFNNQMFNIRVIGV